jgi:hypothetical protein
MESFDFLSNAVRCAQSMGYHRSSSVYNLPPVESRLRELTWWRLFTFDRSSALMFGRPFMCQEIHGDIPEPEDLNFDETESTEAGQLHPASTYTDATYLRLLIHLARIEGEIYNLVLCSFNKSVEREVLLKLDHDILAFEAGLPAELISMGGPLTAKSENTAWQRKMLLCARTKACHFGLTSLAGCKRTQQEFAYTALLWRTASMTRIPCGSGRGRLQFNVRL